MATIPFTKPIEETIAKVDDAVAVGEDLKFQRRWWRFEHVVWAVFSLLIVCDVAGPFGRGYLAKADRQTSDQTMDLKYERIERAGTPSAMTFRFGAGAVHDGMIRLFVSENLIEMLGEKRISPQPAASVVGGGGVTYTFPASDANASIAISLEPRYSGAHHFSVGVVGAEKIDARVVVLP